MSLVKHLKPFLFIAILVASQIAVSGPVETPKPALTDTCPVCGMFVSKYPAWLATVVYKDGHAHHFDGAKDMFKYLLDMPKWAPGHKAEDIQTIGVTEYYTMEMIEAKDAYYVIGSEVYGPMGHELIPLVSEEDAKEYMQDHKGVKIMRFDEVKYNLLINLDNGVFSEQ
jgi:nitrous oxide reductase accessory protein NosL